MKNIKILGTGCPNCKRLMENTEQAAKEFGDDYDLKKITDMQEIMKFNIMSMPALVVDGKVRAAGRVLSVDEIKAILAQR